MYAVVKSILRPGVSAARDRCSLVISPADFNRVTNLPVILPITNGGEFARRTGFAVLISGIETNGVVRWDQPRVIDLAARGGRKVDTLPEKLLNEVLARTSVLFT